MTVKKPYNFYLCFYQHDSYSSIYYCKVIFYKIFFIIFTAKLWDARYGDVVHTFDHEHIVKSVNFNSDDTLLLTASNEKLIRVFDLNKPEAGRKFLFLLCLFFTVYSSQH